MTAPLKQYKPHRVLRWVAYALGGLLVLVVLAWALVRHGSYEHPLTRSDGTIATVRWDTFRWRWQAARTAFILSSRPIASILSITDAERTVWDWHTRDSRYESNFMIRDHRGGYCVATFHASPSGLASIITTCWLGPQGERVPGFPPDFPLRRCVENRGIEGKRQQDFDPAKAIVRFSLTARLWWKVRTGGDVLEVPERFINEILDTEFGGSRDLTKGL